MQHIKKLNNLNIILEVITGMKIKMHVKKLSMIIII